MRGAYWAAVRDRQIRLTKPKTSSTEIVRMQTLSLHAVCRLLNALTQGLQAIPA